MHSPYSLKAWLRYLDFKTGAPFAARKVLYERALKRLPGSYKLWFNYLMERKRHLKGRCIASKAYKAANNAFERALVYMSKVMRSIEPRSPFRGVLAFIPPPLPSWHTVNSL